MKFGMPVWYGNKFLEKAFKKAGKLGFEYIELSLDYPWHPNQKLNKALAKLKKFYGFELAFHLPIPELNLCHPSKEISEPALSRCIDFLNCLLPLNPTYVNLHLYTAINTAKFKEIWEEVVKRAEKVATRLHNFSKAHNLLLTFENGTYSSIGKNFRDLNFLLKKNLNFCLDIGHAAVVNFSQKEKKINSQKLLRIFKKFKRIVHVVHLHDVAVMNKHVEDHLALGDGEIELGGMIGYIKETDCKYLLLEIFNSRKDKKIVPAKISDLKNSLKICRKLFE